MLGDAAVPLDGTLLNKPRRGHVLGAARSTISGARGVSKPPTSSLGVTDSSKQSGDGGAGGCRRTLSGAGLIRCTLDGILARSSLGCRVGLLYWLERGACARSSEKVAIAKG